MNIEQLEELRRGIKLMRGTLEEDGVGAMSISEQIDKLESIILEELKRLVWHRYLEAEGQ